MRIGICDTIDKSMKLKLATTPVNPVQWTSHYFDEFGTDATPVSQDGTISNTTAVTVVDSPIADHIHIIRELSVHNPNAADIKAYLQFINGGSIRITKVWTIPANDSVFLDEKIIDQYFVDGLKWRGDWAAGTYDENDVAKNDGKVWVALVETTEEPIGTPTDWDILVVDGADGADGADGREVEMQASATHIQWRYVGEVSWTDIIALADLKGDKGDQGDKGDKGDTGAGVPTGGTAGQVLAKIDETDYNTEWVDQTGGSDEKVKYDADDPTAGYLADKIVAGTGITLEEGTGADENKLKIIGTASYTLPLAGAARGGIKAATKGAGDTVECKIDESGEKLYVPTYPAVYWQRNSTVLSPVNAGDSVTIDNSAGFSFFNFISKSDFGSAYVGQNNYAVSPINLYSKSTAETNALGIISVTGHSTSETAADGFGVYDEIQLDSTTTPSTVAAQIVTKWSTAAHATATSIREWWLKGAGAAIARVFAMTGLGQPIFDKLGAGTFTGTPAKYLAVTSAGLVIEQPVPAESKWTRTSTKLTPTTANDIVEVSTNDASNPAIKGITSATLKAAVHGDGGAAGYGVYGEAQVYGGYFKGVTAGNGLLAEATAGIGAAISNTSTTVEALRISKNTAATDALVPFAVCNLNSTGTAAAGLGVKIAFNIKDAAGSSIEAGYQAVKWSAATAGSVSSVWEWYHYRAGTPELCLSVLETGQLVLPLYTGSSFSGTPTKYLATDSSGNVLRVDAPTSSGATDVLMVQVFS